MTARRIEAVTIAVLATLGFLPALMTAAFSAMLFDSPAAGGWPVYLLFAGMLVPVFCLPVALIAALMSLRRPRPGIRWTARTALLLPLVLLGAGIAAVEIGCDGRFTCGKGAG